MQKRKIDVLVISDVHLGSPSANATNLIHYLKTTDPAILIINGDFIDGWNFKKKYFPESHIKVLRYVLKLITKGTKVYYLTGNHDEFLRSYHGFSLAQFTILDQLHLRLDGKVHWFFHGDLFDYSIQGRMKYLAKIGGKSYDLLIWFNRKVNMILQALGKNRMSFSKRIKSSVKLAVKWVNDFEKIAADLAISEGIDVVCCGHVHTPTIKKISNKMGQILYLNSGDWIENNSALEYVDGQWSISNFWDFKESEPYLAFEHIESEFYSELETVMFGYSTKSL